MESDVSRRMALRVAGATLAAAASDRLAADAGSPRLSLRLIGTSDLHANVFSYDYFRDRPDDTVGLAKIATLIAEARAEAPNTLLFDNGDIIQGTPFGDYAALGMGLKAGDVHPMIAAMNTLGYAACTLGNHEFNYGLELLEIALAGANFPAVCCNILKPDGSHYYKPWLVVERELLDDSGARQTLRIGIIGFAPPQIVQWDESHLAGRATTIGVAEAARIETPKLRAEGVDVVLALCHSGISHTPPPQPGEENAALALSLVPGIDAMFLGHQHLLLPGADFSGIAGVDTAAGALSGVPAFMPGFWGSHLGVIDLRLERREQAWRVASAHVEVRPIYKRADGVVTALATADATVLAAAQRAHDETLAYVRAPVGEISAPVNSFFALVADDPSVQIVNAAQGWYLRQLAEKTTALQGAPILSAAAPFKAGGRGGPDYYTDVKAGPIAMNNVADLYLYPNTVRVVRIDGATVREWLERAAGIFLRIDPTSTAEQPLIDPTVAAYNFDVIDGVTYTIDVTKSSRYDSDGKLVAPDSHRIQNLEFQDKPIEQTQLFLVATNNYRASGGGTFPGCDGKTIVYEAPDANRDVVVRYIQENKRIDPKARGDWRLARFPDSVVATFLTSPAAASAPPPVGLRVTAMGPAEGGFVKYRIAPTD
jgi:2',3'-cyclic-nucleotide 2'-phosphodiesterase/3'-nucleotidase